MDGGGLLWALREAAARAGYHSSGAKANLFYAQLAKEINTACTRGLLDCWPARDTLILPSQPGDVRRISQSFIKAVKLVMNLWHPSVAWIAEFEEVSKQPTKYMAADTIGLRGQTLARPFHHSYGTEEEMKLYRDLTHNRLAPLYSIRAMPDEKAPDPLDESTHHPNIRTVLLEHIEDTYRSMVLPLSSLALLLHVLLFFTGRYRQHVLVFLVNTTCLLAIVSRLMLVALMDATSCPTIHPQYLDPIYPLLYLFCTLTIAVSVVALRPASLTRLCQVPEPRS